MLIVEDYEPFRRALSTLLRRRPDVQAFTRFIADVLREGGAIIALVTEEHEQSLQSRLRASKLELAGAIRQRRYIAVNIGELLARVTVNGLPDRTQFLKVAEEVVTEAGRGAGECATVAACGECSPTLWAKGYVEAAIQLEHLWDEIAKSRQMDVLCAYPLTARDEAVPAVRSLCAEHTSVEIR